MRRRRRGIYLYVSDAERALLDRAVDALTVPGLRPGAGGGVCVSSFIRDAAVAEAARVVDGWPPQARYRLPRGEGEG